jgi:hypothetical protein
MLIAFAASSALALAADEIVTMKAKNGDVKFNHTKHKAPATARRAMATRPPGS